jgi:hypothetical protein
MKIKRDAPLNNGEVHCFNNLKDILRFRVNVCS